MSHKYTAHGCKPRLFTATLQRPPESLTLLRRARKGRAAPHSSAGGARDPAPPAPADGAELRGGGGAGGGRAGVGLPRPGTAAAEPEGAGALLRRPRSARYVGPVTSAVRYLEAPRGPVRGASVYVWV